MDENWRVGGRSYLLQLLFDALEFVGVGSGGARFADLRGGHDDGAGLVLQFDEDAVPVVEAFAARLAVGRSADVTASAAVAFVAADARETHARSVAVVTLQRG